MIFVWFMIFLVILFLCEISLETYNNFQNDPDIQPDNCYYYVKNIATNPITNRQKDILYDLDAVRTSQSMLTNRDLQFTGGCAINPKRDLDYITMDDKCNITGQVLTQDIDSSTGYFNNSNTNIKLKTQIDYAFPNVSPAYSCYMDTVNQKDFFSKIDTLADMKNFKVDQQLHQNLVDLNNANTQLDQYNQMVNLYGLST